MSYLLSVVLIAKNLILFSKDISLNTLGIFFFSFRVLQSELTVENSYKIFTMRRGLNFIFQFKLKLG